MNNVPEIRTPLMLMFCLGLIFVSGCQVEDLGSTSIGPMGGDMVDGPTCTDQLGNATQCVPDQKAACALILEQSGCTDEDGDCFPTKCSNSGLMELFNETIDCNDSNPATHPYRTELCDGVDNDCDGKIDETFNIGEPCSACGDGVLECASGDLTRSVCSTLPGQTGRLMDPVVPAMNGTMAYENDELCNKMDDDCDDRVDEHCVLLRAQAVPRTSPVICDAVVSLIEDNRIITIDPNQPELEAATVFDPTEPSTAASNMPTEGTIRFNSCAPTGHAWLMVTGECSEQRGPTLCEAILWLKAKGQDARPVTALSQLGPPKIAGNTIYWHTLVGDRVDINRVNFDEMVPTTVVKSMSDPIPIQNGSSLIVRRWEGERSRVTMVDPTTSAEGEVSNPPGGRPGVPVANEKWIAWVMNQESTYVWVVPIDSVRTGGFQALRQMYPINKIGLKDNIVAYSTRNSSQSKLDGIDLQTGRIGPVIPTPIQGGDFDLSSNLTVWLQPGRTDSAEIELYNATLRVDLKSSSTP